MFLPLLASRPFSCFKHLADSQSHPPLHLPIRAPCSCVAARITDLPTTLLDRIDLNLDLLPLARPLGFGLTAVHFLLRAPLWSNANNRSPASALLSTTTKKDRWAGRFDASEGQGAGWDKGWFHWVSQVRVLLKLGCRDRGLVRELLEDAGRSQGKKSGRALDAILDTN